MALDKIQLEESHPRCILEESGRYEGRFEEVGCGC
jgi:hypothetical protein